MPNATLPDSIEIFRPGRHVDDAGGVWNYSAADLAATAAAYDPALHDAPLTVGHPAHNLPAYGWVKGVSVSAEGRLQITPRDVEPAFAEMVAGQRFPKRSASFYPPEHPNNPKPGVWYLRHVGFLGAQPPAIKGLKDIQFAEGDADGAVSFSEQPDEEQDMSKELQAQLDEANAKARAADEARAKAEAEAADSKAKLTQFSEQQKAERHAGFVSFAEDQVKAGKLLPKDREAAVAVLGILADAQPVEFAEGGATKKLPPAEWLKGLIAAAKPVVSFGEFAPGGTAAAAGKARTDAEIDAEAKAYQRQHKVSYAEALTAVAPAPTFSA